VQTLDAGGIVDDRPRVVEQVVMPPPSIRRPDARNRCKSSRTNVCARLGELLGVLTAQEQAHVRKNERRLCSISHAYAYDHIYHFVVGVAGLFTVTRGDNQTQIDAGGRSKNDGSRMVSVHPRATNVSRLWRAALRCI
jgi:hypothetical protein